MTIGSLKPYPAYKASGAAWLGEVPEHWKVLPLKQIGQFSSGAGFPISSQGVTHEELLFVKVSDMNRTGNEREIASSANTVSRGVAQNLRARVFDRNTIIFPKVGGALLTNKRRLLVRETCIDNNLMGCVVTDADPMFAFRMLLWLDLGRLAEPGPVPAISEGEVREIRVTVPPRCEQAAIVRFLDHADRRIRCYIRAKQKLIALLEEQKQVIIHQAVTGRIDVRTGRPYPAYTDSGIEWLGAVPAHWDVRRSKRVFRPRTERARPGDTQLSATQTHGVIAQADYEERIGRKVTKILRYLDQRRHVEVDDFVISMRSFQGGLERAWRSGCIRSSYIVLQAATELTIGYFGHLFKSVGYIRALQSTANFIRDGQDLNFENFCRVDVPFPPVEEQRQIARAVDREMNHIASSIERSRRQIGSLHEYRARLIADVVTGKLDVREIAAGLPDLDLLAAEQDPDDDLNQHPGSGASGDAEGGGPVLDIVDAERSEATAAELMPEGR